LRAYGVTYNDIKGWGGSTQHVPYNVIVDAFKDGRADVLFAVITPKHPSVSEIASGADVKFLGPESDVVMALAPLGYVPATMRRHVQGPERGGEDSRFPDGPHHQ
jgi:uncharacterized protein